MAPRKATTKRTAAASKPAAIDIETAPIEAVDDDEARVLAAIDAEFGDDGAVDFSCKVYKITRAPGERPSEGWVYDCGVDELETLRSTISSEEWGGPGRYRVRISKNKAHFRQYDMQILRDMRPKAAPIAAVPAAVAAPVDGLTPFERALLQIEERAQRRHEELIRTLSQAPQRTGLSDVREVVELLQGVRQVAGPENTGLQMFREGMQLMRDLTEAAGNGGGGGDGGLMGLATKAIEAIGPMLAGAQQQQPQARALPGPTPQPIPQRTAPIARVPQTTPQQPNAMAGGLPPQFARLKDYLLAKAGEGAQPDLYVDYTVGQLGQDGLAFLEEIEGDPLDALCLAFPDITPHRLWFARLLDAMGDDDGDDAAEHPKPIPANS